MSIRPWVGIQHLPDSDLSPDKPELPADLKNMTVMAASVLHLDTLVQEIQAELSALRRLTLAQTEVLKAFSDLYLELTDESGQRKFLSKSVMRAEREAQRLRLPLWYWRPEPELELKVQIFRRARFLMLASAILNHDNRLHKILTKAQGSVLILHDGK